MTDDSGQESKEQDPVEAIRKSLKQALSSLKNLFAQEKKEEEELEEEVVGVGGGPVQPVDDSQSKTDQSADGSS